MIGNNAARCAADHAIGMRVTREIGAACVCSLIVSTVTAISAAISNGPMFMCSAAATALAREAAAFVAARSTPAGSFTSASRTAEYEWLT
jgi:hypothetical protein